MQSWIAHINNNPGCSLMFATQLLKLAVVIVFCFAHVVSLRKEERKRLLSLSVCLVEAGLLYWRESASAACGAGFGGSTASWSQMAPAKCLNKTLWQFSSKLSGQWREEVSNALRCVPALCKAARGRLSQTRGGRTEHWPLLGHHKHHRWTSASSHRRKVPQKGLGCGKLQGVNWVHFLRRVFLFCNEVKTGPVPDAFPLSF